ncbi:hypothetical protein DdX_01678 [Ditylenchus destructor]|uniref:Uncharacterized protein n=1 Tax=Ditylenchus destructor TaxID=166010 RepID=A0AAD4NJ80_9BILA|nr:hypothetical protein DdX_01678 [Ditylenchus destructor]
MVTTGHPHRHNSWDVFQAFSHLRTTNGLEMGCPFDFLHLLKEKNCLGVRPCQPNGKPPKIEPMSNFKQTLLSWAAADFFSEKITSVYILSAKQFP